jgi:hypothetical protein
LSFVPYKPGTYNVTNIIGDLEFSVGPRTLGVYDTLRDTLSVEMSEQIDQVEILQEQRTVATDPLGGFRVEHLHPQSVAASEAVDPRPMHTGQPLEAV